MFGRELLYVTFDKQNNSDQMGNATINDTKTLFHNDIFSQLAPIIE